MCAHTRSIYVDNIIDCIRFVNINIENCFGPNQAQWQIQNLVGFDFHRCHNPFLEHIQFFNCQVGVLLNNGRDPASNRSMTNCTWANVQFNLCARAILTAAGAFFGGINIVGSYFQNTPLSFLGVTAGAGPLLDLQSNDVEIRLARCTFVADNVLMNLGAGGPSTQTLMGYPNVSFSSCAFRWNGNNGNAPCFNLASGAKVTTSAQFWNGGAGAARKAGDGQLILALEVTE